MITWLNGNTSLSSLVLAPSHLTLTSRLVALSRCPCDLSNSNLRRQLHFITSIPVKLKPGFIVQFLASAILRGKNDWAIFAAIINLICTPSYFPHFGSYSTKSPELHLSHSIHSRTSTLFKVPKITWNPGMTPVPLYDRCVLPVVVLCRSSPCTTVVGSWGGQFA